MAIQNVAVERVQVSSVGVLYTEAYRLFAYVGLFSVTGMVMFGFRYEPGAGTAGVGWNALLYGSFVAPHLVMTRSWFKRLVWGNPAGTPRERRTYIFITVVMWMGVILLHRPIGGQALAAPAWVTFAGVVIFLMGFMMFFEGVTRAALDGLLGVPGSVTAYSHGPETPLFTEGPYAKVRHPMYRGFIIAGLGSLLIHPNMAQLFWVAILASTFIAFIPVEEAQLLRARGHDYRAYQDRTPWRLFRGIW